MRAKDFLFEVSNLQGSLPSIIQVKKLIPQMLVKAQEEYDNWDEADHDTYAGGGICHIIADKICDVLNDAGVNCSTVSCSYEQHVYVAIQVEEGVYTVDIPYHIYETGGGFNWKKLPDVKFESNDIVFYKVTSDSEEFERYIDVSESLKMSESLDAPYPIQVGPSPYKHDVNHYTAKTMMPNGKELEVNFVPVTEREKKYYVDFWVDGTQHLTGKGDQQRIFATVLSAIRQFIEMNSPDMLKFSAMKNKRYNDNNPMSRVNLYNKLVKKYAQAAGYDYSQRENEAQVSYTLTKKADTHINEVNIDNEKGWGEVPLNRSVDYHGLRVLMKPSIFLKLAAPDPFDSSVEKITQHITSGGAIASPFLDISIPNEWEDGDVSKLARIVGHEGRNRMKAIKAIEGDYPIEVHLFIRGGIRRRHITDEWIKSMQSGMYSESVQTLIPGPLFTPL